MFCDLNDILGIGLFMDVSIGGSGWGLLANALLPLLCQLHLLGQDGVLLANLLNKNGGWGRGESSESDHIWQLKEF